MNNLDFCRDVELFQEKFGLPTPTNFRLLPPDLLQFRAAFLQEEFDEFKDSHKNRDYGTAIDSLIDLIYVTCGAWLLHGLPPQTFEAVALTGQGDDERWRGYAFRSERTDEIIRRWPYGQDIQAFPDFLSDRDVVMFLEQVQGAIRAYPKVVEPRDVIGVLMSIYTSCRNAMLAMGLNNTLTDLVWKDVQRANMSKERALRAEDSKRGSTWDVIKPKGWTAPDPQAVIEAYTGRPVPA